MMALPSLAASLPNCSLFKVLSSPQTKTLLCNISSPLHLVSNQNSADLRGSANYQPSSWSYEHIQSITSEYGKESYVEERDKLKAQIRMMFSQLTSDLDKLEFIDVLQKLGLSYIFVLEIRNMLQHVYNSKNYEESRLKIKSDLHTTALQFRILRQHGYDVSSEVFTTFKDDKGNFGLDDDIKGMLSLYEASFHSMEGETVLEEARNFCSIYLKQFVKENKDSDEKLSVMISHTLEFPPQWRIPRFEVPWFIDLYQRSNHVSPAILNLACLDFNVVQATHQQELKYTSSWWKEMKDGEKLSFVRDMPTENFFWGVGMASHPELSYFRREMTKITSFITIIDDIYDVYGTLQELELFTHVVHRWDINSLVILPSYMKICFFGLYNSVNEVAFAILKRTGIDIIPYLKKVWGDLCESYLKEARWYNNGHVPSLQEYLDNAWISVGGPVALVQGYFLQIPDTIRPQEFEYLQEYPNIIRLSSTIIRLANDLASYKVNNGDVSNSSSSDQFDAGVPKSLKCYMKETGASEQEAYEYVYALMCQTWKKMNEAVKNSEFSQGFTEIAMNLARMAQYMYQHGDGHSEDSHTNRRMLSLLHNPIPITASHINGSNL